MAKRLAKGFAPSTLCGDRNVPAPLAKGLFGVGCHLFWWEILIGLPGCELLGIDPMGEFL